MRILVAGVGNVLRADDAFGVEVARRMEKMDLPDGVTVVETGIGGMALVQELQGLYDALIVADAVDLGRPPGQIMLIEPDVIDVDTLDFDTRWDLLADMHLTTPERVFMLAKALGVLPARLLMVGCQPLDPHGPSMEMSPAVAAAVDVAIREVLAHIEQLHAEAAQAAEGAEAAEGTPA
jgi:hydrogenase maturation protease